MTHGDGARVADLLARLGEGDSRERFRRLLEQGQDLIDAELTAAIGAAPHERSEARSDQRNGPGPGCCRPRPGTWSCGSRRCGSGRSSRRCSSPGRRVDKALWGVIMTAYTTGTSTRKVDDLVRALGCESGFEVDRVEVCAGIDDEVALFRSRRLDHVTFPYVYPDATYITARINHRIISRAVVVATGSPPTATARCSVSTSATPRTRCSGRRSSADSKTADWAGCRW